MNESVEYWNRQPCGSLHPDPTKQRFFTQPHIKNFAQFERWRGKEVLEIGCGIGTDTIEFARAGARIFAVDLSEESVNIVRARMSQFPFGESACISTRNAEQNLPNWNFDLAYSFGVLHHTPNPEAVLANVRPRLKDTGELRIMLYAKYSWKHLFTRQQPEAQAGCPYVKWYSKREARKLLESCGFKVVSIHKTHIFPWRIPEYRNHLYKKAFPWSLISEKYFERFLGHHLLLVARKDA